MQSIAKHNDRNQRNVLQILMDNEEDEDDEDGNGMNRNDLELRGENGENARKTHLVSSGSSEVAPASGVHPMTGPRHHSWHAAVQL